MAYDEKTSRELLSRLRSLEGRLSAVANRIQFEVNKGGVSGEQAEVLEQWSKVKAVAQELEFLIDGIAIYEKDLETGDIPDGRRQIVSERLERDRNSALKKIKSALRIEKAAGEVYERYKNYKGRVDENEEQENDKKSGAAKEDEDVKMSTKTDSQDASTPKESIFDEMLSKSDQAIETFNKNIPGIQKAIYDELIEQLRKLDLNGSNIKTTVANLNVINSIKNKLLKLILSDNYLQDVKEFVRSFNEITKLQNAYWKSAESSFKSKPLLNAIKEQAITDTVSKLTEAGIGANIAEPIADILRTNITTGGSYKKLTEQLRENLVNTQTPGTLEKYVGQITTDAVNQYSNQYTQIVSNDLGYEWFKYDNTDILTTRPFCDAMTDRPYFHISEVPALLRAEGLTYVNKKTGKREPVVIYEKTGLPSGMIPGTDASNFFIRRGGYRCGHSIRPVNQRQVPQADKDRVYATSAYKNWKSANS
jgi:hypothetical protein